MYGGILAVCLCRCIQVIAHAMPSSPLGCWLMSFCPCHPPVPQLQAACFLHGTPKTQPQDPGNTTLFRCRRTPPLRPGGEWLIHSTGAPATAMHGRLGTGKRPFNQGGCFGAIIYSDVGSAEWSMTFCTYHAYQVYMYGHSVLIVYSGPKGGCKWQRIAERVSGESKSVNTVAWCIEPEGNKQVPHHVHLQRKFCQCKTEHIR